MVTPSIRKLLLIPSGLVLLAIASCGKVDTSAPFNGSSSAPGSGPAANAAPKSATPNSFDEVTSQLDPGGDLYVYISTAQWLSKLSHGIDTMHDLMLSGSDGQTPEARDEMEKAFASAKDTIEKSGIEDITGIGISSFSYSPGLYRNKLFIHHEPDKGSGVLWSLYGGDPHPLTGLDLLPIDTGVAAMGDFDLAKLINFLRQQANASGFPSAQQSITQWQTQFAAVSGLQLDDVLASLNGSLGMVVTLDATSNFTVPIPGQPQTIPTPRIAILIAVKNDLIFKQVDKTAGANPGVIKVDEPDFHMRTMQVPPFIPGLDLRPSVAQWNGFLVIASDDKLIRDIMATQKGAPGYKSTSEYTSLSAGLPQQGNSFGVSTLRFGDVMSKFQSQMMANQPGADPARAAFFKRIMGSYQKNSHMISVGVHEPNGWLSVSQGSTGFSQAFPVAMAAGAAAVIMPATAKAQEKAVAVTSMSRERQICLGCTMYANDNGGAFPPALDSLFPNYLPDRSILISPFSPGDPNGYNYTPGHKSSDSPDTIIIEDKYAPMKSLRIVGHADGHVSSEPVPAP